MRIGVGRPDCFRGPERLKCALTSSVTSMQQWHHVTWNIKFLYTKDPFLLIDTIRGSLQWRFTFCFRH